MNHRHSSGDDGGVPGCQRQPGLQRAQAVRSHHCRRGRRNDKERCSLISLHLYELVALLSCKMSNGGGTELGCPSVARFCYLLSQPQRDLPKSQSSNLVEDRQPPLSKSNHMGRKFNCRLVLQGSRGAVRQHRRDAPLQEVAGGRGQLRPRQGALRQHQQVRSAAADQGDGLGARPLHPGMQFNRQLGYRVGFRD